jgi:hypothetical protein
MGGTGMRVVREFRHAWVCAATILPLLIAAVASVAIAQLPRADLTIDDLRAIATARIGQVRTLQMACTVNQEPPGPAGSSGAYIRSMSYTILVDRVSARYRMEQTIDLGTGEKPEPVELAFDGEIGTTLLPVPRLGVVDDAPSFNGLEQSRVLDLMMLNSPNPARRGTSGSLESLMSGGVLREQMEDAGGRPCYVVDAVVDGVRWATVWLDPDRGLLPAKKVIYAKGGSEGYTVLVTCAAAIQTASGEEVWMPTRWETEGHVRGQTLRTSGVVDVKSIILNQQVEDQDFRIAFPPGTTVADHVLGMTYVISESGDAVQVVEGERLPQGPVRSDAPPRPRPEEGRRPQRRPQRTAGAESRPAASASAERSPRATGDGYDADLDRPPQIPAQPQTRPGVQSVKTPTGVRQPRAVSQPRATTQPSHPERAANSDDSSPATEARSVAPLFLWLLVPVAVLALVLLVVRRRSGRGR